MRIGRTSAYKLANQYLATNGADGIPCIRIGKQLRVPRNRLEHWLGGPLTTPAPSHASSTTAPHDLNEPPAPTTTRPTCPTDPSPRHHARHRPPHQTSLPFSS